MSLYKRIIENKHDIAKQFVKVLPCDHKTFTYNNYKKQCYENTKIYRRHKPIDKKEKYNLLNPRSYVTESTNPKKYDKQKDFFPQKTETLLKDKPKFNDSHMFQNMGYIDDESFLLNINHKSDKDKTFNIFNNIAPYNKSSSIDRQFEKTKGSVFSINETTNRKYLVGDLTNEDQGWCTGSMFKSSDFNETQVPEPYTLIA